MLVIRFSRIGKKHQPSYRIVVAERRSKLGGVPVEDLGFYDPISKKASVNKERVGYWVKVGAKPSPSVWNLCVREGAIQGKKMTVKISKKKSTDEKPAAPAAAAPAAEPAAK